MGTRGQVGLEILADPISIQPCGSFFQMKSVQNPTNCTPSTVEVKIFTLSFDYWCTAINGTVIAKNSCCWLVVNHESAMSQTGTIDLKHAKHLIPFLPWSWETKDSWNRDVKSQWLQKQNEMCVPLSSMLVPASHDSAYVSRYC